MITPPVPARMAHRPTLGGHAVPYVTGTRDDGTPALGVLSPSRVRKCHTERRCQACGQPLDEVSVLFARPVDFTNARVAEPAHHPECAAYAAKACPMLTGRMEHYRATERRGVNADTTTAAYTARRGAPAEPWYSVRFHTREYRLTTFRDLELPVIDLAAITPLKIRLISAGNPSTYDLMRIALAELPWGGAGA